MYLPKKEQFHSYTETEDGVFGLFDSEGEILEAAKKTRDAGKYTGFDVITPYPIHHMDDAMGLPRSGIPWVTFIMGLLGCTVAFSFQYLVHTQDWPLNIAGKPFNSWPAFIPVTFELTIFFAGFSSVLSLFLLGKMFNFSRKPLHPDLTSHRFALWIPKSAPGYNEASSFIQGLGAKDVTVVNKESSR